jgi:HYR domain
VDATAPGGTAVVFSASATDDRDGVVAVTCVPPSGSTFPVGTTPVACRATDADGAESSGTFLVTVRGAGDQLADLLTAVQGVGPGRSLPAKVASATEFLAAGDAGAACRTLAAFVNEVRAQAGKHIPSATAAELTADAERIRAVLGC